MPTIQDTFTAATGDDTAIVADKAQLDADVTKGANDHATLSTDVAANGPTLVSLADGTPVALIPQTDGTVQALTLKDGRQAPTPVVPPTPTPAPAS